MNIGGLNDRFTFDPATHTYRVDGKVLPGVTTVIKPLIDYSMVSAEMLALAAERGSAAHLATEYADQDMLDEDTLDPRLAGYLQAWRQFRLDKAAKPIVIERQLAHTLLGYCCTLDRIMTFGNSQSLELVEIKTTSQLLPATGVQLVGQELAWIANGGQKPKGRHAVQLRDDGTYRFKTYSDPDELPTFMACLALRRWNAKKR
ncbi:hypothetical protein [Nevskia ramosa]|uniref:hypothetical protein n=1 Tax=Nevskia ramosa TaxID=64002 RepID=UPI003D10D81B